MNQTGALILIGVLSAIILTGIGLIRYLAREKSERHFILNVFLLGEIFRAIAVFIIDLYTRNATGSLFLFSDEVTYHNQASLLTSDWTRGQFENPISRLGTVHIGHQLLIALIYWLTGTVPLHFKLVNALISGFIAVFAYFLAKELIDRKVARLAAILVTFFPSLIFWSATLLKDGFIALLISATLMFAYEFHHTRRARNLMPLAIVLLLLASERFFMAALVVGVLAALFFVGPDKKGYLRSSRISTLGMLTLFTFLIGSGLLIPTIRLGLQYLNAYLFSAAQTNLAWIFDQPGAIPLYLLRGVALTLLNPLPWKVPEGWSPYVFLYPGMWVIFLAIPFMLSGAWWMIRNKTKSAILLILPFALTSLVYILAFGDGGSRQLAQSTPLLLILAATGIVRRSP